MSATSKLRFAVIGAGMIGDVHAEATARVWRTWPR
jgi:hypothetical protein